VSYLAGAAGMRNKIAVTKKVARRAAVRNFLRARGV